MNARIQLFSNQHFPPLLIHTHGPKPGHTPGVQPGHISGVSASLHWLKPGHTSETLPPNVIDVGVSPKKVSYTIFSDTGNPKLC